MNKLSALALAVILMLAAGAIWFTTSAPDIDDTRQQAHKTLETLGFMAPIVATGRDLSVPHTFRRITLDPDEFGRIKELKITPSGAFSDGRFKRVEVDGLGLTGALVEGRLSLSGLVQDNRLETPEGFLTLLNMADTIVLKNTRIDIFSEDIGGFGATINAELNRDKDSMRLTGDIRSVQSQFSLEGKLSGTLSPTDGSWELTLSIEQGKADFAHIFASRLYGEASLAGTTWDITSLQGQMSAGSAVFHGFAFQAPSFTFEKTDGPFKLLAEAKDAGKKTSPDPDAAMMEFGFLYSSAKPGRIQTSIFAPDTKSLTTFLGLKDGQLQNGPSGPLKNLNLSFETPLNAKAGEEIKAPFILKSEDEAAEKSGFAVFKLDNKSKKAEKINIIWNE